MTTYYTQISPMPRRAAPRRRLAVAIAARARARGRGGITLMEVLISIGIILMGLAGVSALLPVGRYQIAEAAKRDRSAACGRAVLRDLQVRGMIDPAVSWSQPAPSTPPFLVNSPGGPFLADTPMVIDPIGIASGQLTPNPASAFPCNGAMASCIPRLTFDKIANAPAASRLPLATLFCTWRDELEFDVPDDAAVRPKRMFRMSNGDASTDVVTAPGNIVAGDSADNYSWLLTVSPSDAERGLPAAQRRKFEVSVVVLYKRQIEAEYMLNFSAGNLGLGGGDVMLSGSSVGELRPGEWVLVGGGKQVQVGGNTLTYACGKWYRILAAPPIDPSMTDRRVTLAGPDWNPSYSILGAVHMPGVVGVYTENVEVQR